MKEWMTECIENKWIDMNKLTWRKCNEWIEMKELKWTNWNEGTEMNELTWQGWNEGIEMNQLKLMNWNGCFWNEWITWVNWHERILMNDLTDLNWNEWIETSEGMIEYIDMNERREGTDMKELKWLDMNKLPWRNWMTDFKKWVKMKKSTWKNWNERRDMIEWTWIHGQKQSETDRFLQWLWYGIFATVSCTSCRPHHPRVLRPWHFLLFMWDWDLVRLLPRPSIFHDCYVLLRLTFAFY